VSDLTEVARFVPGGVARTQPVFLAPTIVGARYQLINKLGEGAMGSVHRALDRLTGRIVTLKRLRAADPSASDSTPDSRSYRILLAQEFGFCRHSGIPTS